MIKFDRWFLPDGETHLQAWMTSQQQRRDGRLTYQLRKYEAALRHCRQRRRAVDVGAHVGLWSYWMAKDFQDLLAFEPKRAHRECWRANMNGRGGTLLAVALGTRTGLVSMLTGPSSSGDTYVRPDGDTSESTEVATLMTLDEFVLTELDLLKIDCEGYELFVVQGARETILREQPVIIVEQKPGHGAKYGIGDLDAVAYLRTLGYAEVETINGDVIMVPAVRTDKEPA